jgi:hypothetical protein
MMRFWNTHHAKTQMLLCVFAISATVVGGASAAPAAPNESELLGLGFKVLVAQNEVQRDWVKNLASGRMNPMQRTGKKYFIYPDASRNLIYVGGPQEYEAYLRLHPINEQPGTQEAANRAYRAKQDDAMRKATARDLSDPFLGASWADLGW